MKGYAGNETSEEAMNKLSKQEARMWTPIDLSIALADALKRLTKADMMLIRQTLAIEGGSSLKKEQLAEHLAAGILSRLQAQAELFDEERYRLVKTAADRGDAMKAFVDPYQLNYFLYRGLLFPGTLDGERVVVMPQEIKAAVKALDAMQTRQRARRNTQLILLARGALFYCGALEAYELWKQLKPIVGADYTPETFYDTLAHYAEYESGIQIGAYGFADEGAVDPESILREHQSREALPYRTFAKEELLAAGESDYVDRNAAFRAFAGFILAHYDIPRGDAEAVVTELTFDLQNGDAPSALIESLQEQFDFADMEIAQGFVDHLGWLNNNTRLWVLKGHTPHEVSAAFKAQKENEASAGAAADGAEREQPKGQVLQFATGRKVGRNDPCPCGSGKKFKKCCGG